MGFALRLKDHIHTVESEVELKSLYPSDIMKRHHVAHGDAGLPLGELDLEKGLPQAAQVPERCSRAVRNCVFAQVLLSLLLILQHICYAAAGTWCRNSL